VFVKKKLPEQLRLHCYAVSTHQDELVLEPPLKKILDLPMTAVVLNRVACFSRGRQKAFKGRSKLYSLYNIESLRPV